MLDVSKNCRDRIIDLCLCYMPRICRTELQPEWINTVQCVVFAESVEVGASRFAQGVAVQPAPEIRVVIAVAVIIEASFAIQGLGAEPIGEVIYSWVNSGIYLTRRSF